MKQKEAAKLIGNNLYDIRVNPPYKMNQREFANYLGMPYQQYNRYESGKTVPTLELAYEISIKLNRTIEEVFPYVK